jgi:hypothetical protein
VKKGERMKRVHVSWIDKVRKNKAKGIEAKDEQVEVKDLDGNVVKIPANLFFDAAVKGMGLLREHGFGTQAGERDISLEITKSNPMYPGNYIVSIYYNNVWIHSIWCDKIERYADYIYCPFLNGENIGSLYSTKVKIVDVPITDKLLEELRIAEVSGIVSMLLDVQRDCIAKRKLLLDVINKMLTLSPLAPSVSDSLPVNGKWWAYQFQTEGYPIAWDDKKFEFVYKEE